MSDPRLKAALGYARRGWRVLPLHWITADGVCSCGNAACARSSGKHPLTENGVHDATVDEAVIRQWWTRWPVANVGIATGRASRLVVLDTDPRNGGTETFDDHAASWGALPETIVVFTGSGGTHHYFTWPTGDDPLRSKLGAGIDVQGEGKYVVAPPSMHASGRQYAWQAEGSPDEVGLAALPAPWLAAFRRPPGDVASGERRPECAVPLDQRERRARAYVARMPPSISGQGGHLALWEVACVAVRGFALPAESAMVILREFNGRCLPPWSDHELSHKVENATDDSTRKWGYLLEAVSAGAEMDRDVPLQDCDSGSGLGGDACRNQIRGAAPAYRWPAKPLSALSGTAVEVDWIWDGYIAPRSITMFTGVWKGGKTTMLAHLLKTLGPQV